MATAEVTKDAFSWRSYCEPVTTEAGPYPGPLRRPV
jgi:hypothetical protein